MNSAKNFARNNFVSPKCAKCRMAVRRRPDLLGSLSVLLTPGEEVGIKEGSEKIQREERGKGGDEGTG